MTNKLLLEIGTEEIPAKFMEGALLQLKNKAEEKLLENRINFAKIECFGTPRRIVLAVSDISSRQSDLEEKSRGPIKKAAYDEKNEPTKALLGFLKNNGCRMEDLSVETVGGNEYVFVKKFKKGDEAKGVLEKILPEIILSLTFPKSMRWGDSEIKFARPVRWLLALLNNKIINFSIEGLKASNLTRGHRTLADRNVVVKSAEKYFDALRKEKVIVDQKERKDVILKQIEKLEKTLKARIVVESDLLEEIIYLVEYPTVFSGSFDKEFLSLPKYAIITPMRDHQRYFPVFRGEELLPCFIGVRNGDAGSLKTVQKGNERVLRARLKDVQFFYNEDLKKKLEERVDELKGIVYQAKLGTVFDKVQRILSLSHLIGKELGFSKERIPKLDRAVYLCKADLVTGMVNEFGELQGIMGKEYALKNGEDSDVAEAIRSHYLPRYAEDGLPADDLGIIISIADKLDSVVGSFALGTRLKGSHDPFGLRRQAIGVINIILKNSLKIDLDALFEAAINLFDDKIIVNKGSLKTDLDLFFKQRLRVIFDESGFRYDLINSVIDYKLSDLLVLKGKLTALTLVAETEEFKSLSVALSRAYSLSQKVANDKVEMALFENSWEKDLYNSAEKVKGEVSKKLKEADYAGIIEALRELIVPINNFFDNVLVMSDKTETRNNRLALLKNIEQLSRQLCDFEKIVA